MVVFLSPFAHGCAKGTAEKRVEVGLDGETATFSDFANRQVGFFQHVADFLQLPPSDGCGNAFFPYLAEAHLKETA